MMICALNMGKLIYKNSKNKWHMIKADPRFGAWHMINSSATDLRNKDKADEDAFAKLPNANMQHQHQQTGPNPLKNPKVSPFLSHFSEDDLKDEKYTLTDKMTY
ncbi:hypothetical protein L195_g053577, partial [Trifolium pratense]